MKYTQESQTQYLAQFINRLSAERNLSQRTLLAYRCDISGLQQYFLTHHVPSIDSDSILEYFLFIQQEQKLSATSIRRKYVSIRQYCQFLNEIQEHPEVFFRFSSRKFQIPKRLPKTLTKGEIRRLITAVEEEYEDCKSDYRSNLCVRDLCIIELLFCLGLRVGEVAALNLEDYDEAEQSILIRGKGSKERLLYLPSVEVREKLKGWLKIRLAQGREIAAMFTNRFGGRLSVYSIENVFYKYREKAHINPLATPHYLRHSFATQLLNNGAGIRDVQELLGHSSIVTTQIYTEVSLARKREVMEKYNGRNFLFAGEEMGE